MLANQSFTPRKYSCPRKNKCKILRKNLIVFHFAWKFNFYLSRQHLYIVLDVNIFLDIKRGNSITKVFGILNLGDFSDPIRRVSQYVSQFGFYFFLRKIIPLWEGLHLLLLLWSYGAIYPRLAWYWGYWVRNGVIRSQPQLNSPKRKEDLSKYLICRTICSGLINKSLVYVARRWNNKLYNSRQISLVWS